MRAIAMNMILKIGKNYYLKAQSSQVVRGEFRKAMVYSGSICFHSPIGSWIQKSPKKIGITRPFFKKKLLLRFHKVDLII